MKKPASILVGITILALVLGWVIGGFFTSTNVSKVLASIPASPIVVDAKYNKTNHTIEYSMLNPGGTTLTIVQESFVFQPGKESKEKSYIVSNIPVNVKLLPGIVTKVELKLKEGTEALHFGDVVLATFTYTHPLSPDLYTVVHPFTMGQAKSSTPRGRKTGSKKQVGGKKK